MQLTGENDCNIDMYIIHQIWQCAIYNIASNVVFIKMDDFLYFIRNSIRARQ